jgi:hypothetical protein
VKSASLPWVALLITLGGCTQPAPRSQSAAPTSPPAEPAPTTADRPTTRPTESQDAVAEELLSTAEAMARDALRQPFEELQRSPDVQRLLVAETRQFDDAFATDDLATFYVRDMSMKIRREIFVGMTARGIVRGYLIVRLSGSGYFSLGPNEDIFIPRLSGVADEVVKEGPAASAVETFWPGYTARFTETIRNRLTFSSDYDLRRFLFTTDFRDAFVDHLSIPDLLSTWTLMQAKKLSQIDGAESRVELVQTPLWDGIGYGALELNGRYIVELHGLSQPFMFDCVCQAKRGCDAVSLQPVMNATLASICQHGSRTPGGDMLAEARRIQALPHDEHTDDLVCALVLCAAQYDDAFEQAVGLYATLPRPDWPPEKVRDYDCVLHRQYPD